VLEVSPLPEPFSWPRGKMGRMHNLRVLTLARRKPHLPAQDADR
jgi:hypothetical protein